MERREISYRFNINHGLKGAVAIVDGTQIILSQRPHIDGETYWTRKGRYSINLQIICDDKKMIRSYVVGWPGSVVYLMIQIHARIPKNISAEVKCSM